MRRMAAESVERNDATPVDLMECVGFVRTCASTVTLIPLRVTNPYIAHCMGGV